MSLGSKLGFLLTIPCVAHTVTGTEVVIVAGKTLTGSPIFIDILKNSGWNSVLSSDISRLTLVGFSIQADDHDMYGSRWCVDWFNQNYPKKFFVRDSRAYHTEQVNTDGTFSLIPCTHFCDHKLKFHIEGDDGDATIHLN